MQRKACHRFCEERGWPIVYEFQEDGISGHKVRAEDGRAESIAPYCPRAIQWDYFVGGFLQSSCIKNSPLEKVARKSLSLEMVETRGIEPLTSWMPFKRSPRLSYAPRCGKENLFECKRGVCNRVYRAPSWVTGPYPYSVYHKYVLLSIFL